MLPFALRRLVSVVPVALLVSLIVFLLIHMAPGDPISLLLSDDASQATINATRIKWGLDQPLWIQYLSFLGNLLRGDLGVSFRYGEPVVKTIFSRLPATFELAFAAITVSVAIALPLGLRAGARPNGWADTIGSAFGFLGISMPSFWLGIMLILFFSGTLHILPSSGSDSYGIANPITGVYLLDSLLNLNLNQAKDAISHLLLPATALGFNMVGMLLRVTRSSMVEIMHEDYITAVRAKGASETRVVWRHGLRNALVPILTVVGLELGALLSGSIIIETVFSWPGMGSLLISAVSARDYPLVIGTILVYTTIFILINFTIDLIYPLVDPRIRLS